MGLRYHHPARRVFSLDALPWASYAGIGLWDAYGEKRRLARRGPERNGRCWCEAAVLAIGAP